MKHEAISRHERPHIVTIVADWQTWQGKRLGFHCIIRRRAEFKQQVFWEVQRRRHTVAGQAGTVTAAIEEVNEIIAAGGNAFKLRRADPAEQLASQEIQGELFDLQATRSMPASRQAA